MRIRWLLELQQALHDLIGLARLTVRVEPGDLFHFVRELTRQAAVAELLETVGPRVDAAAPVADVHAHRRDDKDDLDQRGMLHHLVGVGAERQQRGVLQPPLEVALLVAEGRERHEQGGEQSDEHQHAHHFERPVDFFDVVGQCAGEAEDEQHDVPAVRRKPGRDVGHGLFPAEQSG